MPPSQLKRLKASLRSAGVTGQQQSKKAKGKRKRPVGDKRLDQNVALQSIREEFNPFEIKKTKEKHQVIGKRKVKGKEGRPGISKQIGEENRKRTLLVEMQGRNKAGGIVDRRFGENDPSMTPEERMLERFTREKQKRVRGGGMFNLESDDELAHFGQSLGALRDDFDAENQVFEDGNESTLLKRKRPREVDEGEGEPESDGEELGGRRSKAEIMKEVIAKSKLHRYERQKAREDDDDERMKIDAEMGELWTLLGAKQPPKTGSNGSISREPLEKRGALEKEETPKEHRADGNYDQVVREMMFEKRSKPTDRTKTDEEKAAEESERLKKLEEARQRRMRGEEGEDGAGDQTRGAGDDEYDDDERGQNDAAQYGLGKGIPLPVSVQVPDFNPDELVEGDYEISDDGYVDVDEEGIVDGDVDHAGSSDYERSEISSEDGKDADPDEENFLANLLTSKGAHEDPKDDKVAYTYPCPQTHGQMLEITKNIAPEDSATVVQRIRVLYHPKLAAENKEKLSSFSAVLLEHIVYLCNLTSPKIPFPAIDLMIRHLHALAKQYPTNVSGAFREHLKSVYENRMNEKLSPGDLMAFTAIGTIFPTSDHNHQVVTPALVIICKWLGQVIPEDLRMLAAGSYLATLCIQYQRLSKRYIPEVMNFTYLALSLLAPKKQTKFPGGFPYHHSDSMRISTAQEWNSRKIKFSEIFSATRDTPHTLLATFLNLLESMSELWVGKSAFEEAFAPAIPILSHLGCKECTSTLGSALRSRIRTVKKTILSRIDHARHARRPLELHHHRPLPIPLRIPKFEEDFNPERKSYDPDADRRELAKLRAEYKREKKGAMRELRKDAHFIARVKLSEDKKTSQEYHSKMARIVATIQTEEGAAANEYEREKRARKRVKK